MPKTCQYNEGCSYPVWGGGMCQKHQFARTGRKPKGFKSTQKKLKPRKKPTGELAFFNALWAVRPHVSFVSGKPVQFAPITFSHILNKNVYKKFRLYDKNIVFLTPEEHFALDHGTEEDRIKLGGDWNKLYKLKEELRKEYEGLTLT